MFILKSQAFKDHSFENGEPDWHPIMKETPDGSFDQLYFLATNGEATTEDEEKAMSIKAALEARGFEVSLDEEVPTFDEQAEEPEPESDEDNDFMAK